MNKLSDWLNNELKQRGWTHRELARRANISQTQVSDVINEKARPGARFCRAIARPLGRNPDEIMRLAGLLPSLPPPVAEEDEVMRIFRSLPARFREAALAMLRGLIIQPVSARTIAEPSNPYESEGENESCPADGPLPSDSSP